MVGDGSDSYGMVWSSTGLYGVVCGGTWRSRIVRSGVIDSAVAIRSILLVNGGT